jgi:hypothetical protein
MPVQHILLFSGHPRPSVELPVVADGRYRIVYCASDDRGADVIEALQQRVDWVLIDGAEMGGNQKEFFQLLRAIGFLLSERESGRCQGVRCHVEWNANGVLQLRCSRPPVRRHDDTPVRVDPAADVGSYTFEYHAPMHKTG